MLFNNKNITRRILNKSQSMFPISPLLPISKIYDITCKETLAATQIKLEEPINLIQKIKDKLIENVLDKEDKILLFLGFSEDQVGAVLKGFPKTGSIKRPIFCGLTEQNMNWTLDYLIEHLVEEDKYWSEQDKKKRA